MLENLIEGHHIETLWTNHLRLEYPDTNIQLKRLGNLLHISIGLDSCRPGTPPSVKFQTFPETAPDIQYALTGPDPEVRRTFLAQEPATKAAQLSNGNESLDGLFRARIKFSIKA